MAHDPARLREKNIGSSTAAILAAAGPAPPARPYSAGAATVFSVSSILNGEDSESPGRVVSLQEDSTGVLGVDNCSDKNQLGFHMYKFFSNSCENQLGFHMYKFSATPYDFDNLISIQTPRY
jgi:hypothetical protein